MSKRRKVLTLRQRGKVVNIKKMRKKKIMLKQASLKKTDETFKGLVNAAKAFAKACSIIFTPIFSSELNKEENNEK